MEVDTKKRKHILSKIPKWYFLLFFIWLWGMIWGTTRIYTEANLNHITRDLNNERMVFNYEENWGKLKDLQPLFEKNFLQVLAHIDKANEKEEKLYSDLYYDYSEVAPYRFAYFNQYNGMNLFENSVWIKEENTQYLDVVTIKYEGEGTFSVSVSNEDLEQIKRNHEKLQSGQMKLRPKNFEQVKYNELQDQGFYTYAKDAKYPERSYTYLCVKKTENPYETSSNENKVYNLLVFRYVIEANEVLKRWGGEDLSIAEPSDFSVQRENKQLLENINNRVITAKALAKEIESDGEEILKENLEDLVTIQGKKANELLKGADFCMCGSWQLNKYMLDTSKKAVSVKETIIYLDSADKLILIDKYMKENQSMGRAGFEEAEKNMKKDIEQYGENSKYYQWIRELGLTFESGKLMVDFGDGYIY